MVGMFADEKPVMRVSWRYWCSYHSLGPSHGDVVDVPSYELDLDTIWKPIRVGRGMSILFPGAVDKGVAWLNLWVVEASR